MVPVASSRFRLLVAALVPLCVGLANVEPATTQGTGEHVERALVLEGFVLDVDGNPAEGALVVSAAGGRALTDASGSFRLEVVAPSGAGSVQVTAIGAGATSRVASATVSLAGSSAVSVGPLQLARGAGCAPEWVPTFGETDGVIGVVQAFTVFDDGSGPSLYVGGTFSRAGGVVTTHVARWDGERWHALGVGVDGQVRALVVHDDGSGPALYAGGGFTTAGGAAANRVAKWDGESWSAVGGGTGGIVNALASLDDGSGPALYAGGGVFALPAGSRFLARWDGSSWSGVGTGPNGDVHALAAHAGELYAGGDFLAAGGAPASRVARWDGAAWSPLGSGASNTVRALAVWDAGVGPVLYAGGSFQEVGGVTVDHVAAWDGASWSDLDGGTGAVSNVFALRVHDGALYAGGNFTVAGGVGVQRIARWDGASWSAPAGMDDVVLALGTFDAGDGARLFAGGGFDAAGGVPARSVARLDGASWAPLGDGLAATVDALCADSGGEAFYAGGQFEAIGALPASRVARWDGSGWSPLGAGVNGPVRALASFDDGGGSALYAGGAFTLAGGAAASRVARWDGAGWSPLGSGVSGFAFSEVRALCVFDEGGGPALFAAGAFSVAGGVAAHGIARWDGSSWSALGAGGTIGTGTALCVFDDGSGAALYVGGSAGSSHIARWNGSDWSSVGGGLDGDVRALCVFDDGGGPALYAGGFFDVAGGGVPAERIARWDGVSWSALESGVDGAVFALTASSVGGAPALFAGGAFSTAGGTAVGRLARWDGAAWSAVGGGVNGSVLALASLDGPELLAGGAFLRANDSHDSFLARYACVDSTPPVLAAPTVVNALDRLSGAPGEVVTFVVTATDDVDPEPIVVCVPPSGSLFPRGTTLVTCTATDAAGNQSTCAFPVRVELEVRSRPR